MVNCLREAPRRQEVTRKGEWHMLRAMHNEGVSISAMARQVGLDRKTVRRVLAAESWPEDDARRRVKRPSKLDPFKGYIRGRLEKAPLSAVRLCEEIRRQGYTGGMSILKEYVHGIKEEHRLRAVVRFETMPGEQAQVDWAKVGMLEVDGERRGVYAFVMALGYSRMRFVTFSHSMDLCALMRCHIEAFAYFGGHTRELLYDNLKTVITHPRTAETPAVVNRAFADFAGYYGFRVGACAPYRAQTKGKVERLVGYVKNSFCLGREFADLGEMKRAGLAWCDQVNARTHGTTGKVPAQELLKEGLIPIAGRDFDTSRVSIRVVARDCFISYEGNRYSVPYRLARRSVCVRDADDGRVRVFSGDELVADHRKAAGKRQVVLDPEHTAELWRKVLGREPRPQPLRRRAVRMVEPARLVLVGRKMPLVRVESRDLSYYEEVAG
jgi:transposase